MKYRFVIDESSFQFTDESDYALEESYAAFLSLLDYIGRIDSRICKWSELFNVESASGDCLWQLLSERHNVDRDLRNELSMRLDRVVNWDDDLTLEPVYSIKCAEQVLDLAPSIGLCILYARKGWALGCLDTIQSGRRGKTDVISGESNDRVKAAFLANEEDGPEYWRIVLAEEATPVGDLFRSVVRFAYPRCIFAPDLWEGVKNFEGSPIDYLPRLYQNLAGLNDHAIEVWSAAVEPRQIAAEMKSRADIDCSPESPKTRRNAKAIRERDVSFGSMIVECQWHAKLEPHRNRVHFAVKDEHVFVGVLAAHLTT